MAGAPARFDSWSEHSTGCCSSEPAGKPVLGDLMQPVRLAVRKIKRCALQVTFCSLSGDIFPQPIAADRRQLGLQAADDEQVSYLRRLLTPVVAWISPAQAVLQRANTTDEAELSDACR